MNASTCPHGLARGTCEICRVLEPTSVEARPVGGGRPPRRGGSTRLAGLALTAVVAVVVIGWVAAAVWALLRVVELLAVAAVTGWAGYQAGVRHGRRLPPR